MRDYELRGNGGRPIRGVFWLDDLPLNASGNASTFVRAVSDPSVRHHAPRHRTVADPSAARHHAPREAPEGGSQPQLTRKKHARLPLT